MSAVFTPERIRITIDRYQKMGQAGVFAPNERVELIEGEILSMAPIGTVHADISGILFHHFALAVGNAAVVRAANPLDLGDDSEPQPDLMLLRPQIYRHSHPRPTDVLLLVEVSDSTLNFDQGPKRDLYANYGIAEYWVVDVNARRIIVYLDPVQGAFQRIREYVIGGNVSPQALPDFKIIIGELFE